MRPSTRVCQDIFVVASKRTPFGAFGGKLKDLKASELGAHAAKAALAELPEGVKVDEVFFGLCGSGFQSLITAAQHIKLGEADTCVTGGAEAMSMSPFTLSGSNRTGMRFGQDQKLEDSLFATLTDLNPRGEKTPMGITAENLGKKYGITRQDADNYALQSQQRYAQGLKDGAFKDEIAPITLKTRKGDVVVDADEHPKPQTTIEALNKLPSVFIPKTGTVSPGNASGISDGGAANIVMGENAVKATGAKPLARVVSYAWSACEPSIMGIGPVASVHKALERAGLSLGQMDLIDINEAFATQWLAVAKELDLPNDKSNMFGGAIAVGHPLAASGARIIANLVHNLHRLDKKYALGGACIGGGQGIAVILERV
ncbi:acetyl-Coenzyme A acyltransferase 2 [Trichosporon asahii var. asahii CBS 2479]|uniref:Acetyl-Coenzyme A acyltransferase 2 n=1 Tax=Trichosporon asahii var. asahii (strain ATCC 90039 / CBS 2479 / JCM 2466 / KCTC 7840 / NBRC 103889/ NCYC 2677 / UAMH 7654) TaxID=1186058 RepID=J4UFY5_TRIAS|nr:acetyl-Coenzyme A acyltransferase 2 [Trichosporon asahii var. asahii CBS 2479]EJT50325.1 acetyl-Coenzyme A acyltransferase 2 [Trichosporon asahii var. asahii CBS 2479]